MKKYKLLSCLFLMGSYGVWGCGEGKIDTCATNDDCTEGYLCNKESCEPREPVVIDTEELVPATKDLGYDFTLVARDGIPPYVWSLGDHPEWISIDPDTGRLFGKPLELADDLEVEVLVQDSSVGRDSSHQEAFTLYVERCNEDQVADCWEPGEDERCGQGRKICAGGEFGPCIDLTLSTSKDHCGPGCEECEKTANQCTDGRCACGWREPCDDMQTCCGRGESAKCCPQNHVCCKNVEICCPSGTCPEVPGVECEIK